MSKDVLVGICTIIVVAMLNATTAAADNCELCYSMNERYCREQCQNLTEGQGACNAQCMKTECDRHCGVASQGGTNSSGNSGQSFRTEEELSTEDSVNNEVMSCRSCLARMEQSACAADCESSENRGACAKRCAKYRCVNQCNLPIKSLKQPRKKYQSCSECKEYAAGPCRRKCGDSSRPGFVACEVSCVETKCLRTCNERLF